MTIPLKTNPTSISVKTNPTDKVLELGGGARPLVHPNVDVRQCFDEQGNPTVDIVANLEDPLPIQSEEWDAVFSQFVIEHLSWRKVRSFLREVCRILKPGGKAVFVTANTPAQLEWVRNHPEGWDGKPPFESFSCLLFGDQDYPENAHKNWMSPELVTKLLEESGFTSVGVIPYGAAQTDMVVQAIKVGTNTPQPAHAPAAVPVQAPPEAKPLPAMRREEMFDKHYFNGGGKVGGYAREGYWDYPVHHKTVRHVLARRPSSVLELGCSRGYVLKRLQDAGIPGAGLEISKHCYLTRACTDIVLGDLCEAWLLNSHPHGRADLCYSVATLEHIPEEFLPHVITQMQAHSRRGLHGVDFGHKDDGFDKTHCTLKPKTWWISKFHEIAPDYPVEIVDKEELESGDFPEEVLRGDGKVKVNVGSFTTMYHHGWVNTDIHDLTGFAQAHGYQFRCVDARGGLPWPTGSVDLIHASHFLEHLSYDDGVKFLKECRRALKPEAGVLRIAVPDASLLQSLYFESGFEVSLADFGEINDGCAKATTRAAKLWALLHEGHSAIYDTLTLKAALEEAFLVPHEAKFRQSVSPQMLAETLDMFPDLSLYMDATCLT